jgi:hypothetical protein
MDGSVLSAPYDPDRGKSARSRDTDPPRTEILTADNQAAALSPTHAAIPAESVQPTITAPPPPRPDLEGLARSGERAPGKSPRSKVLIAIAAAVVVAVVALAILIAVQLSVRRNPKVVMKTACGHAISEVLYDKWMGLGGETGKLGCPINDETVAPGAHDSTSGRWIEFAKDDGAYLILRDYIGVFVVNGCIFKLYKQQGGTNSPLGFPTGNNTER